MANNTRSKMAARKYDNRNNTFDTNMVVETYGPS